MNRRQRRLTSPPSRRHTQAAASRPAEQSEPWWQNDWALLAALLLAFAVYRFAMLAYQPGPPGSDAGNWLAFTRDLFGQSVKAADSMYFPGTLVILKALLVILPDLAALKVLAVGSSLAIAVPFYFLARMACNKTTAVLLSVLLLMAGFLIEMMSWGGYPQLLGSAYVLAVFYFADRWLFEGRRKDAVFAAGFAGLIALTHHFSLLILLASLALYAPVAAVKLRAEWQTFLKRGLTFGGMAAAACLVSLPWYLKYMSILAGSGSLNATAGQVTGRGDILSYVFSEAPLTWLALGTIIPLISVLPFGDAGTRRLRPIAASLVAGPLLVYLVTNEHRAFQPAQAGALLCFGIIAAYAQGFLERLQLRPAMTLAGRATLALAAVSLLLIIVPNSHARAIDARNRYAAMDTEAAQAMSWLRENTPTGAVVLPSNRKGLVNYAWWVEGFGQRPAYGLIDPHYLAFREEVQQAEIAKRIIDESTPVAEAQRLLDEAGIRYLFIYKPSGGDFQHLADSLPVTVSYQNDAFVILKLPAQSAVAHE